MKVQHYKTNIGIFVWDSEKYFISQYRPLMEKFKKGDQSAYERVKDLLVNVFFNTVDLVNQGFYFTEDDFERGLPDENLARRTHFYDREFRVNLMPRDSETIVEVLNIDCLEAVQLLQQQGYDPALLNMANRQNPGGGVIKGAGTQEETIFRRTNLYKSLYQFAPYAHLYDLERSSYQYPLDRNYGGIYSPSIICFRESEENGYKLMRDHYSFAVISVAAMNRPQLTSNGTKIISQLVEGVKNKIRTIFRIGLLNGHDSLVLGALGCGAFRNPPAHVARLFHEVMDEPEFKNKYAKIVFAILDDHNAHKKHNPEGNYLPFVREFI